MARYTVVVQLDEGPSDEDAGGRAGVGSPGTRHDAGRQRWWVLPVVAAVVLAGLGGAQAAVNARQRSAWFTLAETSDAVLRPLSATLTVTPSTDLPLEWSTAAAYQDTAVGLAGTADGSVQVVAADLDTWQVRWRRTLLGPADELAVGDIRHPSGTCARVPGEAAVACLIDDSVLVERDGDFRDLVRLRAASAHRLVVLDARTGAVRIDHELDASTLPDLAFLPGVAVVAVPDRAADPSAGGVDLVGIGLDDGVQRWRTATSVVLGATGGTSTTLAVAGDTVAFAAVTWDQDSGLFTSSSVTFVGPDGAVARTWSGEQSWIEAVPSGGGLTPAVLDPSATTIMHADGDVTLPGLLVPARSDDGSLGAVWFTTEGAYDASGGELWRMPVRLTGSVAPVVLRGTVYVAAGGGVLALDGATGQERWSTGPLDGVAAQLVTDGSVLGVVTGSAADLPSRLVAFDLGDGARRWDAALPDGLYALFPHLHLMVGWSPDSSAPVLVR